MSSIFKSETIWTGNTYPVRAEIAKLGGRWDSERKGWIVPPLTMRERGIAGNIVRLNGILAKKTD